MGQCVVLHDAPELRLVPAHDGEVLFVKQFRAVSRFAVAHVGFAVLLDDVSRNP